MKRATAAVIVHNNKTLIAQRVKDNFWEFPGGKIDPGETPDECIIREMKEELNIDIRIERSLGVLEGTYRGIPMQVYAYTAAWTGGTLMKHVHKDIKWVERKDIEQYPLVEEDKVILKQFL